MLAASAFHSWNSLVQHNTTSCHIFISRGGRGHIICFCQTVASFKLYLSLVTVIAAGNNTGKKGPRGKKDVGRKYLINLLISDMFKVNKESWLEKLNFQNAINVSIYLFIWLTLKTNSSYPPAYLLNLLFIYGVILIHIRAHLHSERKKKPTFSSSKLRL